MGIVQDRVVIKGKPRHVGVAAGLISALVAASCESRPDAPSEATPSATVAMSQALTKRALAYPEARITAVSQKGVVACGLVTFEARRPHVVFATNNDNRWVISTPYLVLPNSWDDERNRALSEIKIRQCAHFGLHLPITR